MALVYGSVWKQRYFTKRGDDYFPEARAVGCYPSRLAALFRGQGHRLVGAVLSAGQYAAPDGSDLRWLPLGRLQHPHETGGGVERWMREVPRAGK